MKWKPNHLLLFALLVLGCAAYSLPWLINPGNGLSFGAYDLAEWTSLHPVVRSGNPILLTTLLLRMSLACLGLTIGVGLLREKLGFAVAIIVLTAIALLPPLEFFTQYRDDPNYLQQFFLALVTFAGGILSIAIMPKGFVKLLIILLALVGAGSSLAGLLQGHVLLEQFKLPTQFGMGGISLVAIYAVITLCFLTQDTGLIKQTR